MCIFAYTGGDNVTAMTFVPFLLFITIESEGWRRRSSNCVHAHVSRLHKSHTSSHAHAEDHSHISLISSRANSQRSGPLVAISICSRSCRQRVNHHTISPTCAMSHVPLSLSLFFLFLSLLPSSWWCHSIYYCCTVFGVACRHVRHLAHLLTLFAIRQGPFRLTPSMPCDSEMPGICFSGFHQRRIHQQPVSTSDNCTFI